MRPARARAAEGAPTSLSPDEALAELKSGNERYVSQPEVCALDLSEERAAVARHQAPFATIIACADSRSPPELIFGGHGVGRLFVARNAGNLVDTATLGTVSARSNMARWCSARLSTSCSPIPAAAR